MMVSNERRAFSTSVYWTNQGTFDKGYADGTVMKVPLAGGPTTTLVSGKGSPSGLAVDATSVYWTNHVTTSLRALLFRGTLDGETVMKPTPK